ncbi:WD domain-containing protein [Periconia macrospinosa]|uniref:WD domain-containing protein n=1 Tax=Periconia macrospinosa TaxID=97972 RepID=A0A2V1D4E2_9PLEO|nr:WD domain-containing protein [Periconia macrospinosa]
MSVKLHHECTRVPVTASASCGPLFFAAEGPFVRFYSAQTLKCLVSKRIFRAQAVHGISVVYSSDRHVIIVVWGGLLVRACEFDLLGDAKNASIVPTSWIFSNCVEAPDWILYLSPGPSLNEDGVAVEVPICAAVTAHNALLQLKTTHVDKVPTISVSELTSSSRSILYSAHLTWVSRDRILIAAGTAFGEIVLWSWTEDSQLGSMSQIHRVFIGHEGSIFGVQLSRLYETDQRGRSQRFLASCSDDRTIRIWDVSDFSSYGEESIDQKERTHHTGFMNSSFDSFSSSDCLAIGWGHISRVWGVRFLDHVYETPGVYLVSTGEDATTRTWCFSPNKNAGGGGSALPYTLSQLDVAAYHSGKNIWALAIHSRTSESHQVFSCGADSKITVCSMGTPLPLLGHSGCFSTEYTIEDIITPRLEISNLDPTNQMAQSQRSSKFAEFFRTYTFVDDTSYLVTTNTGKIYLGRTTSIEPTDGENIHSYSKLVGQTQDLNGYSVSAGVPSLGIAFVAGSRGSVYMYIKDTGLFAMLHNVSGKVGSLFATENYRLGAKGVILLVTVTGRDVAHLLYLTWPESGVPTVSRHVEVPISPAGSGLIVTSMEYVSSESGNDHLFLGFRQGSVVIYRSCISDVEEAAKSSISWIQTITRAHGKETVSYLSWVPFNKHFGHLISTGRDGHLVIHSFDLITGSLTLVHNLSLPVGPNIEGICLVQGHLLVYGFSSKHFILYDVTVEEELFSVDTGGAHRSWAFQPNFESYSCGILVWTRASTMHICQQTRPSHEVVRQGGHGREIKAVAVTKDTSSQSDNQLIATGAEDTDIKIFCYKQDDFVGGRTLRKHKTGIQHLHWSDDGRYLFSSGGCEEFYIWRVSSLPPGLGTMGVVCESVWKPESEHADLRLMSFDVRSKNTGFLISMVFSDSNIKVYYYDPTFAETWHTVASGTYFTSCLTQCFFLSSNSEVILTAGTDGHAVLWPLRNAHLDFSTQSPSNETLKWHQPTRIHQNTSKTLATHPINNCTMLLASGGDDGSITFLVTYKSSTADQDTTINMKDLCSISPPITVVRAHASAVTACAMFVQQSRIFVVTSGNDQWLRLWEVMIVFADAENHSNGLGQPKEVDSFNVKRICRAKTNVADVSSMAVLEEDIPQGVTRLLVCGVGMEVIRIEF